MAIAEVLERPLHEVEAAASKTARAVKERVKKRKRVTAEAESEPAPVTTVVLVPTLEAGSAYPPAEKRLSRSKPPETLGIPLIEEVFAPGDEVTKWEKLVHTPASSDDHHLAAEAILLTKALASVGEDTAEAQQAKPLDLREKKLPLDRERRALQMRRDILTRKIRTAARPIFEAHPSVQRLVPGHIRLESFRKAQVLAREKRTDISHTPQPLPIRKIRA